MAGLATMFGSGAMSNSVEEIEDTNAMLVIGSNTTENHPIIALRMKKAVRNGSKLIVADPRKIPLTKFAHLWLRQRPGTDITLINSIMHVIVEEGLEDTAFIASHTEKFDILKKSLKQFTPAYAEKITGVPKDDIIEAARIFGQAARAGIYYTMGITQHTSGTNNVFSLGNLALLTGNIGKKSAGVNPLRGQNNVQGCCDMGCSPNVFPGYQAVTNEDIRIKFEEVWGKPLPDKIGLTATEMTDKMIDGTLKGLYIMGENPALSDPNTTHALQALKNLEILVVQDIFMSETAELADVVLPAACFAEKDGTFTNSERRVQRVKKAISPPGEAKDDLTIISLLMKRMDFNHDHVLKSIKDLGYSFSNGIDEERLMMSPEQAFMEAGLLWPAIRGMTYQRLSHAGLQWPCPNQTHPGTPYLFKEGFPVGKPAFMAILPTEPNEMPDDKYPFILTTGRTLFQYHTGTMSRKSAALEAAAPEAFVEMSETDATAMDILNNEMVTVSSRRGSISLKARVGNKVANGVVFIPFHYKEASANILTNDALDPISKIAEAKVCAVKVTKIS